MIFIYFLAVSAALLAFGTILSTIATVFTATVLTATVLTATVLTATVFTATVFTATTTVATIFMATSPVPWFFIIVGIIAVGFVGFVVWTLVKSARKRKELKEKENSVYDGR